MKCNVAFLRFDSATANNRSRFYFICFETLKFHFVLAHIHARYHTRIVHDFYRFAAPRISFGERYVEITIRNIRTEFPFIENRSPAVHSSCTAIKIFHRRKRFYRQHTVCIASLPDSSAYVADVNDIFAGMA